MNGKNYVLEVALFTVKENHKTNIPSIRDAVKAELKSFEGLISLECFEPMNNESTFADIAKWDSLEHAQVAAAAFEKGDFRFLPYIDAIEAVHFMGHFKPQASNTSGKEVV